MNDNTTALLRYLKTSVEMRQRCTRPGGYKYTCAEEFVLREGRVMTRGRWPRQLRRGPMKECFKNSFDLMLSSGFTYCEGYAVGIIPTLHAWCVNKHGHVIDPTWDDKDAVYLGVPFERHFVVSMSLKRGYYGLIDDWQNRWPLLRGVVSKKGVVYDTQEAAE